MGINYRRSRWRRCSDIDPAGQGGPSATEPRATRAEERTCTAPVAVSAAAPVTSSSARGSFCPRELLAFAATTATRRTMSRNCCPGAARLLRPVFELMTLIGSLSVDGASVSCPGSLDHCHWKRFRAGHGVESTRSTLDDLCSADGIVEPTGAPHPCRRRSTRLAFDALFDVWSLTGCRSWGLGSGGSSRRQSSRWRFRSLVQSSTSATAWDGWWPSAVVRGQPRSRAPRIFADRRSRLAIVASASNVVTAPLRLCAIEHRPSKPRATRISIQIASAIRHPRHLRTSRRAGPRSDLAGP